MASPTDRKKRRISMLLPVADITIIDHDASLQGGSRTDFARDAAVCAAEGLVMGNRLVRMSLDGFADFTAILSAPAETVPEMVELARRLPPWEPGYVAKR